MSAFDELKSAIEGMQSGRYVLDIKCISANFRKFEAEFSQLQARAENAEVERDALKDVLLEVVGWISNWEPDFTDDPEWAETEKRIDAALKAGAK